jgi:hypothetical protein
MTSVRILLHCGNQAMPVYKNKKAAKAALILSPNQGSAPTAQQTRAQLEQISGIELAVAILVEQAAEDASRSAALRLDLAALLIQGIAQVASPHALRLDPIGQERHHQRSQQASN